MRERETSSEHNFLDAAPREALSEETREGRRLSFALALRASPGALTGPRAELLIALSTPRSGHKGEGGEQERENKKRERKRPRSRHRFGVSSRGASFPSTTLSLFFPFFLFFFYTDEDEMACTALYFMSLRGDVLIARTYRDEAE